MKKILLLGLLSCCLCFFLNAQKMAYRQGELLVKVTDNSKINNILENIEQNIGLPVQLKTLELTSEPMRIWLVGFDFNIVADNIVKNTVFAHPDVEQVQFNHFISMRDTIPSDAGFDQQWFHRNLGGGGANADSDIDSDQAWDLTQGGMTSDQHEIVVCVVEGANRAHTDLQGNLWFNTGEIPNNNIDDDGNGYVDDYNGWNPNTGNDNIPPDGHGTSVSGMIGAAANGQGGVGVNWNVKIMHVDVGGLTESNVIASYTYPFIMRKLYNETQGEKGAFVVATNSSWGIDGGQPGDAPLWCAFYDSLGVVGILSCGATANQNWNIDQVGDLPTGCSSEYMVAVTATNDNDIRTFSGYGATTIDLGAPGESVYLPSGTSGYNNTSGTSFASPCTAGAIALLYSTPCGALGQQAMDDPAQTALFVRDAIFENVDIVGNLPGETVTGGRLNVYKSMIAFQNICSDCPPPYAISFNGVTDTVATIQWSEADSVMTANLRIRETGTTDWDTLYNLSNAVTFDNLIACTEYEVQMQSNCSDTSSIFVGSYIFKTDGCCELPANFILENVVGEEAQFSWEFVLAAESYNLQFTEEGQNNWQTVNEMNLNATIDNLPRCGLYEAQIQTLCDGEQTDFSDIINFETDCNCTIPTITDTSNLTMTGATISWEDVGDADSYELRYLKTGGIWQNLTTTDTHYDLTGLEVCTEYRFQVRSVCNQVKSLYTNTYNFSTACMPVSVEQPLEGIEKVVAPSNSNEVIVYFNNINNKNLVVEWSNSLGQILYKNKINISSGQHSFNLTKPSGQGMFFLTLSENGRKNIYKILNVK